MNLFRYILIAALLVFGGCADAGRVMHGTAIGGSCVPGGPTGQMDFSVCSNIGIVAALF